MSSQDWVLDTRYTFHMTCNKDWLFGYKVINGYRVINGGKVIIGNNNAC